MPVPKKLIKFLDDHGIDHEILEHKTVYTAFDLAQTTKKKLQEIAKTLAVKADKKYMLVVVPASHRLDLAKLKKLLKAKKLEIVKETQIAKAFKVKPGTLTPLAKFHNMPVYVDKALLKSKLILVNAGSVSESLALKAKDLLTVGAEAAGTFAKTHKFKKSKVKAKSKKVKKVSKRKVKPKKKAR